MSAVAQSYGAAGEAPPLSLSIERLRGALLWLTGFAGAIVFIEPSPYELVSLLTIVVFAITGLALRASLMPLVVMLLLYNTGFSFAVTQVLDQDKAVLWVAISWYLSATAVFFAAMLGTNTAERLSLLMRGTVWVAALSSVVAILAYFRLLGPLSDLFLRYGRAQAAFNDPNVLGAFLVLPAMLTLQRVLNGRFLQAARASVLLVVIAISILLTFSRAAWGQFALTAALLMFFTFVTSRSPNERLRIILIAVAGVLVFTLALAALLSLEAVAELFTQRASLEQSYDVGHLGRFGRQILGLDLVLERPFGIGPLQFHNVFPEDPHNTYLNTFLSGGWLTGFVYLTMVLTTLFLGFRVIFIRSPWQPTYIAVYCAFVGTAAESAIIDSDHWRHYFLLIGVIWGLMTVSRPHAAARRVSTQAAPAPALAPARWAA